MRHAPTAARAVFDDFVEDILTRRDAGGAASFGEPQVATSVHEVFHAFPDATFGVEVVVADDRHAIAWFIMSATHQGVWQAVPPTGHTVQLSGALLIAVDGSTITDLRVILDL
jgi:predicted ester cyclase